MKITIFSDVHGDIYSLEKLFDVESSDLYICLGDLVGYGPHSNACIDLAIDKCGIDNIIMGNHEDMYIKGQAHSSCSSIAKKFFSISYQLYKEDKRIQFFNMEKSLVVPKLEVEYILTHTVDNMHVYPNSILDNIDNNYIIGHSHIQFFKRIGQVNCVANVGSLGQNRQSKGVANYVNFYLADGTMEFKSFYSPKDRLIKDMLNMRYDSELLRYYES
ncbi:metallophosphoesterase family protein [Vibrio fluvialis]|nr:metallophosphoesterase family protein [Vibrio fluvialis]MBY7872902.1 metallophosphoesterase family protein [Vibrio fluvialis]